MDKGLVTHYVLLVKDEAYPNNPWMKPVALPVTFPPLHTLVILEDVTDSHVALARVTEFRIDHKKGRFEIWLDTDDLVNEQQRDAFCEANGWQRLACT